MWDKLSAIRIKLDSALRSTPTSQPRSNPRAKDTTYILCRSSSELSRPPTNSYVRCVDHTNGSFQPHEVTLSAISATDILTPQYGIRNPSKRAEPEHIAGTRVPASGTPSLRGLLMDHGSKANMCSELDLLLGSCVVIRRVI